MKILISDKMSDKVEDVLQSKQIDYDIKTGMSPEELKEVIDQYDGCLLYTSPSPRDRTRSRMPSSA